MTYFGDIRLFRLFYVPQSPSSLNSESEGKTDRWKKYFLSHLMYIDKKYTLCR